MTVFVQFHQAIMKGFCGTADQLCDVMFHVVPYAIIFGCIAYSSAFIYQVVKTVRKGEKN